MYLTRRRKGSQEDELLAYWRKANHIRGWFERNTYTGFINNCEYHPISRDDLACLRKDCLLVKSDPEQAPEVLSTQEGFFFGSTDYDDEYFESTDRTIEMITEVLNTISNDDELFYHAWW